MTATRPVESGPPGDPAPGRVWYTSYGSNMFLHRLACYLAGGTPVGGTRAYPGCRDRSLPTASIPVELPGVMYFATRSPVWGGGRAFYDPDAEGRVLARAHLVSASQFADIAAQEMYREPGADLDLTEVLARGRTELGVGRYETLIRAGWVDGLPLLTFTAPWKVHEIPPTTPSAAYVRHLASGLLEVGAWDADAVAAYVASRPGAGPHWSQEAVRELLTR